MHRKIPLFIAFFWVTGAFAETISDCPPTIVSNPVPPIEANISRADCAIKDDFKNSCAFKDWLGKLREPPEQSAKKYLDRILGTHSVKTLIGSFKNPDFREYFRIYSSKNSQQGTSALKEFRNSTQYQKVIDDVGFADPIDVVRNSWKLAVAGDPEGKGLSEAQTMKIVEKMTRDAYAFRDSNLVGCSKFRALMKHGDEYLNYFGKEKAPSADVPQKIDPQTIDVSEVAKFGQVDDPRVKAKTGADNQGFEYTADEKTASESLTNSRSESFRTMEGVLSSLKYCRPAVSYGAKAFQELTRPCAVNLPSKIFPDNESSLSTVQQQEMMGALERDSCYQKAMKEGLAIREIAVATSASTLHNTRNYCKWDFALLASDRSAKIVEALQNRFGEKLKNTEFAFESSGSRGDGSSGECAYFAKEWIPISSAPEGAFKVDVGGVEHAFTEERRPEFDTPEEEKALEKNKYARVTLYFLEKEQPISGQNARMRSASPCRHIEFQCL